MIDMKEKHTSKPSRTDWERVTTMKDEEIDYSDIPPLDANFFKEAHVRWPEKKKQVTLRIDPDVIEFFKKQGKGYQSMINAVLRKYVEAHGHWKVPVWHYMNEYDSLLQSVSAIAKQMQGLQAVAVAQYTPVVETIIATRNRDVRQIELMLDGLLDFCGNEQALLLFRRLCQHYFDIDPAATAAYINAYRELWDSEPYGRQDRAQLGTVSVNRKVRQNTDWCRDYLQAKSRKTASRNAAATQRKSNAIQIVLPESKQDLISVILPLSV